MGGIGTAMCQRLHKDGFKVVAGCGPSRDFNKWLGEQKALGYSFFASVGNVGDWDSTVAAFQKTKAEHGPVDVLVNNAGITKDARLQKMTLAQFDAVMTPLNPSPRRNAIVSWSRRFCSVRSVILRSHASWLIARAWILTVGSPSRFRLRYSRM